MRNSLRAALLATASLVPFTAAMAADDTGFDLSGPQPNTQELNRISAGNEEVFDNQASIGLKGQSSRSAVFGRYNGSSNGGVDVVGSIRMRQRDDWKSGGTSYYDFMANDLSFGPGSHYDLAPNSSVNIRFGQQGSWGVTGGWDAMTYTQSNNFRSMYDTNGKLLPGITPYSSASSQPVGVTDNMQNMVVGTRRDKGSITGKYLLDEWVITGGVSREHKQGTIENSLVDRAGNNKGYSTFPMPINYDTDRVDTSIAYNTKQFQAKLGYNFSKFTDNNANGFIFDGDIYKTSIANLASGVYGQAPNNTAHQLNGQLGLNLSNVTRLNANFAYGVQMQDDTFIPATMNPSYNSGLLAGNPTKLNGLVQTMFGNVALTTRPFDKADLRAAYTIDNRQVTTTAKNQVVGDEYDSETGTQTRNAVGQSWVKQTGTVEGGYRVLQSTRVSLGYTHRDTYRSEAITHQSQENEVATKVRTTFTPELTGSLGYSHAVRTASAPDFTVWNNVSPSGDCPVGTCRQIPSYQAGRTQDKVAGRLTGLVDTDMTLGLSARYQNNSYPSNMFGLTRDENISGGPDVTYQFTPDADGHLFYTYQRSLRASTGEGNSGSSSTTGVTNETHTAGVGGKLALSPSFKIGTEFVSSYGVEAISQGGVFGQNGGSPINAAGDSTMPLVTSWLNSFKLHGDYEYVPGVNFYIGYSFDRLISNDWQLWGSGASGWVNNGEGNPSYAVHTILTKVVFGW